MRDPGTQLRLLVKIAAATLMLVASKGAFAEPILDGGKLVLTNGVSTIEGTGGGGLATWATISGMETDRAYGLSAHLTGIELADFRLESHGVAVGIHDRLEVAYARQNIDTDRVGSALGLGQGYTFKQDIFSAKLRLLGDLVYGPRFLPQISLGIERKHNLNGVVVRAVGAKSAVGTDFTVSATKLLLGSSLLVNGTLRLTKANQFGLLGFGGDRHVGKSLQYEGSMAWMLTRRFVIGGEFRTRPDNLGFAHENSARDVFAALALNRHTTITAAFVDVGSIATFANQRGGFLSFQVAY